MNSGLETMQHFPELEQGENLGDDEAPIADFPEQAVWCMCFNVFPHLGGQHILQEIRQMHRWGQGTLDDCERPYSAEWSFLLDACHENNAEAMCILTSAAGCPLEAWERFEAENE